jgi:hypothetical protein
MNELSIYRILSYILLPFAALFGLFALVMLLFAFANPAALLPVFLIVATVIYIIASFIFLIKGIGNAKTCKKKLKDLIKVNAYVAIVFAVMCLIQSIGLLSHPALLSKLIEDSMKSQKQMAANITPELMLQVMKGLLYFFLFFSALLVTHLIITFQLLKKFAYIFEGE